MRKIIFLLLITAMLGITALPAFAASREATQEQTEAIFKRLDPLSQNDIDIFVKHAKALMGAANDADFKIACKNAGFSSNIRGYYVMTKLQLGYGMLEEPDYAEFVATQIYLPQALVPTGDDMELIKKNKRLLKKVFD